MVGIHIKKRAGERVSKKVRRFLTSFTIDLTKDQLARTLAEPDAPGFIASWAIFAAYCVVRTNVQMNYGMQIGCRSQTSTVYRVRLPIALSPGFRFSWA